MASPTKLNLKVYQGSTFRETLRWESSEKVYSPITMISKTAPVVITATAHGIPQGWRTKIVGAGGMKEINSSEYVLVSGVTQDTITINGINAINYTTYTGGGILEYNKPVTISDYTGRMQIRQKLNDTTVIKELTSANGGIIINNTNKTIQLYMSATDTAALSFQTGVYSLELLSSLGEVIQLISGSVSLIKEVTR